MSVDVAVRTRLLQQGRRMALPLPDAVLAVACALGAVFTYLSHEQVAKLPWAVHEWRNDLLMALAIEAGFLLAQGTLVDIATRLKKRPPIWAIPLILAFVVLISEHAWMIVQLAWSRGSVVFIPLLLSIAERGTLLWRMPTRPKIEKVQARALASNRITTGVALFGLLTAVLLVGQVVPELQYAIDNGAAFLVAGAIYFAVGAFDDWRVRGPRFAARPRVLFRFDSIGIEDTTSSLL